MNMVRLIRRSVLICAVFLAGIPPLATAGVTARSPHILLVCQFGTVKSPIAGELLKRRALERHIPVQVTARGITPQQHTTPELLQRLANDGINPAAEPLRKLNRMSGWPIQNATMVAMSV